MQKPVLKGRKIKLKLFSIVLLFFKSAVLWDIEKGMKMRLIMIQLFNGLK